MTDAEKLQFQGFVKRMWNAGTAADISTVLLDFKSHVENSLWIDAKVNPPTEYGKYRVYRKSCDKVHDETWNGTGWAYNKNDITHYQIITKPTE